MPDIEFPTSAGACPGYLAVPAGDSGPTTIVLQEWWGVDEHIRSVCDRFAGEGFFALAPDLYRGETTTQPDEAQQKMMALSMAQAEKDMCGAADYLRGHEGAQGGAWQRWASASEGACRCGRRPPAQNIVAAVSYYYVMPHGKPDFSQIDGPILGHFGSDDALIPLDDAKALEAELAEADVDVSFDYYDGAGHAFFNDSDRLGTYDRAHAERSWERTVAFLRSALAPERALQPPR